MHVPGGIELSNYKKSQLLPDLPEAFKQQLTVLLMTCTVKASIHLENEPLHTANNSDAGVRFQDQNTRLIDFVIATIKE